MRELKGKDINLVKSYYTKEIVDASKRKKQIKIAIPIMVTLAFLMVAGVYGGLTYQVSKQVNEVDAYIKDAANRALVQESERVQEELGAMRIVGDELKTFLQEDGQYPLMNNDFYSTIMGQTGDKIAIYSFVFNSSSRSAVITAKATDEFECSKFVERVIKTNVFGAVKYSGYYFNPEQQNYVLIVEGVLMPNGQNSKQGG